MPKDKEHQRGAETRERHKAVRSEIGEDEKRRRGRKPKVRHDDFVLQELDKYDKRLGEPENWNQANQRTQAIKSLYDVADRALILQQTRKTLVPYRRIQAVAAELRDLIDAKLGEVAALVISQVDGLNQQQKRDLKKAIQQEHANALQRAVEEVRG